MHRSFILPLLAFAVFTAVLLTLLIPEIPRWRFGGASAVSTTRLSSIGDWPIVVDKTVHLALEGDSLIERGRTTFEKEVGDRHRISIRGIGGATASIGATRWAGSECVDIAFLLYGPNDAAIRGNLSKKKPVSLPSYRASLARSVQRHIRCNSEVVILSPLPVGSQAMNERLMPYRRAAKQVAKIYNVKFLDTSDVFSRLSVPLTYDALHLSSAGYNSLVNLIDSAVEVRKP